MTADLQFEKKKSKHSRLEVIRPKQTRPICIELALGARSLLPLGTGFMGPIQELECFQLRGGSFSSFDTSLFFDLNTLKKLFLPHNAFQQF